MIIGPKVGVLPSFVAKIVENNYCTDTSVQPAIVAGAGVQCTCV